MLGIVLALLAASGFGSTAVFARTALQHMRVSTATFVSLAVSAILTLAIASLFHPGEMLTIDSAGYWWILLAALLNNPVGRFLNYTAVSKAGVSRASSLIGTSPLFAAALAVAFTGESMGLLTVFGTFSIVLGLGMVLSQP